MTINNPDNLLQAFFRAVNQGGLDAVMTLYEPQPSMVPRLDHVAEGRAAVREAVGGFLAMKPTLTLEKYKIVTASDLALAIIKWSLKGTSADGQPVQLEGTSSDVMRKQADGRWLFVIDNPWGTSILA
jgi:uncharacterized protein (TIGR02246 family)